MQTITIGRVGIGTTTGDVTGVVEDGEALAISGRTRYGTLEEALTIRAQLLGYASFTDESFVPVTWGEFPHLDGYYRVASVRVGMPVATALSGIFDWSVTLLPVSGFAAPLIETVCVGSLRTSSLTLTGRNVIGIPGAALSYVEWSRPNFTARSVDVARLGETSRVVVFKSGTAPYVGQFYLPPENFYDAAATLKMGSPSRVIVGRQIGNTPTDWELSNDLMQVRPSVSALSFVDVRMWMAGAWSPWVGVDFQSDWQASHMGLRNPHTITVLANSPEAVSIRLLTVSNYMVPVTLDLTLRRGARYVSVELHSPTAANFAVSSSFPSTALTGGFSMSTGTTGLTYFAGSALALDIHPNGIHPNLGGGVYVVTHFPFCFGLTDTTETAQDMLNEYFWAGSEKQTVVAR